MPGFQTNNRHGAKLSPETVISVRKRYWHGNETMGAIARSLGVCRETIARCVRGETFAQYGGPVPGGRELPPGQLAQEAAIDEGIMRDAPMPSKDEIAASLDRLAQLQKPNLPIPPGGDMFSRLMRGEREDAQAGNTPPRDAAAPSAPTDADDSQK